MGMEAMIEILPAPGWFKEAVCRGLEPDIFFPISGRPNRVITTLCGNCPVQQDCLEYALEHDELEGIWGGLGKKDRVRLRRIRLGGFGDKRACVICGASYIAESYKHRICSDACRAVDKRLKIAEKRRR